jgi:hypothetical protein
MKTKLGIGFVACLCALVVRVSFAVPTSYTLIRDQGKWNVDTDWSPNGVPGPQDTATIPAGMRVQVLGDEEIGELILEKNFASGPGIVRIRGDASLTIHGGSDGFDGEIRFEKGNLGEAGAELRIENDLTLSGDGGKIVGHNLGTDSPWRAGVIRGKDGDEELTIEIPPSEAGVSIEGAVEVRVKLVNNGIVTVGDSRDTLSLTTGTKSGGGFWDAKNGGVLSVDVAVSGSGIWYATDPCSTIQFNVAPTSLTGDVEVYDAAILDINENFSTTGELTFRQRSNNGVFPEIRVAAGKTAEFSAPAS